MRAFAAGDCDILVSTTVVEVGCDVPNASVMIVEHAERFGLSQLHQLRGRVGRGPPVVLLPAVPVAAVREARERLRAMTDTTDGFEIAERDLLLRGPGDFFGTRQAGIPTFRSIDLLRDRDLLDLARREAAAWLDAARPAPSAITRCFRRGKQVQLIDVGDWVIWSWVMDPIPNYQYGYPITRF
jgi:ATP-dependent DNA helicase RecG